MKTAREIKTKIAELEAANEAAPSWGAAVGARLEWLKDLQRQLRQIPCREISNECDPNNGECLRCFAASGEVCREPVIVAHRPEG